MDTEAQLAATLKDAAISYRNKTLVPEIVPRLYGQLMTEPVILQVVEPFVAQSSEHLPPDTRELVETKLKSYASKALNLMSDYPNVHQANGTSFLTQDNADALLTLFVNEVYAHFAPDPLLNSRDLS